MGVGQPRERARRTVRRVKGCYECSQRRISCDRAQPQCAKCSLKGLHCSGLGLRYRFNQGVAARGNLAGRTITGDPLEDNASSPPRQPIAPPAEEPPNATAVIAAPSKSKEAVDSQPHPTTRYGISLISNHLDPLESWKRALVNYWSDHIAPAMVAVDDASNGYRSMILPAVEAEQSLLSAISAASSYHLALKLSSPDRTQQYAQHMYTQVINGLVRRSPAILSPDTAQPPPVLVVMTIIVMLVCASITGSSDFPILFRMLSALHSIGNADASYWRNTLSFKEFLDRQVRKFELYAGPLIDESEGLRKVQGAISFYEGLECLSRCVHLHPEYALNLQYNLSLIQQACTIYSLRATDALDADTSVRLVESFKTTLTEYPSSGQGRACIIWATFIAAAESSCPELRAFFRDTLMEFYRMNGFGNLLVAMKMLDDIWSRDPGQKWTSILPAWGVFVM